MKLTKREIALLYQLILENMERVDHKTPVGRIEELQSIELKFSNYYDRTK